METPKFPEYDLKVYYPFGGPHYLIRWYEHDEGHHIILCRNKTSVEAAILPVNRKFGPVKCKEYMKVDIVAPSEEIISAYAKKQFENEVGLFWQYYGSLAKSYKERFHRLPSKLKNCKKFKSRWENPSEDDLDKKNHYSCANCHGGLLPVTGTAEEVFLEHRDAYRKETERSYKQPKSYYPPKEAYDPSLPLYRASPNFGHHSSGVDLLGTEDLVVVESLQMLFFYQNPEEQDKTSLLKALAEDEKLEKERGAVLVAAQKARMEADRMKRYKGLLEIFD
jgi:hypothetical protein